MASPGVGARGDGQGITAGHQGHGHLEAERSGPGDLATARRGGCDRLWHTGGAARSTERAVSGNRTYSGMDVGLSDTSELLSDRSPGGRPGIGCPRGYPQSLVGQRALPPTPGGCPPPPPCPASFVPAGTAGWFHPPPFPPEIWAKPPNFPPQDKMADTHARNLPLAAFSALSWPSRVPPGATRPPRSPRVYGSPVASWVAVAWGSGCPGLHGAPGWWWGGVPGTWLPSRSLSPWLPGLPGFPGCPGVLYLRGSWLPCPGVLGAVILEAPGWFQWGDGGRCTRLHWPVFRNV